MIDNIFKGLCQLDLQNNIIYLNELKVELGSEKNHFHSSYFIIGFSNYSHLKEWFVHNTDRISDNNCFSHIIVTDI